MTTLASPETTTTDLLHWLLTANLAAPLRNATHHVEVASAGGTVTVWIDGTQVLSRGLTLPASAYLGFSGGTGGLTDRHAVSGFTVATG